MLFTLLAVACIAVACWPSGYSRSANLVTRATPPAETDPDAIRARWDD